MSFRINKLKYKDEEIQLCYEESNVDSNIFTLITGKNGVGKTQLLTHIVRNYINIFEDLKADNSNKSDIDIPEKIIVHTNSRIDKFPSMYRAPKQYKNLTGNSYYSTNNEIFTKLLTNKNLNKRAIYETLIYLEYKPIIEYTSVINTSSSGKSYLNETFDFYKNELIKLGFDDKIIPQKQPKFNKNLLSILNIIKEDRIKLDIEDISALYNLIKNKKILNSKLKFTFDFLNEKVDYGVLDRNDFQILIKYRLIRYRDILFYKDDDSLKIGFGHLSSGQQAILNILIGISSVISNNSLICIDEPEISLHPEWQEEIIEKLQIAFKDISGCHFLIATHSPQVVSGLKSENGYILDLENKITYKSIDFSKKSADFQLAKIFNSPGYNNQYILKLCFHLLSNIKDNIETGNEEQVFINELYLFKNNLKKDDPSLYLINHVLAFFG